METAPEEPAVWWAQSRPADLGPLTGQLTLNDGNATSIDPDRATMKAVGETIERYCSAFYDESDFIFGAFDEISSKAIKPERFALFSPEQYNSPGFPFAPFTRKTPVNWIAGRSLLNDCATAAPATFVYIPYKRAPNEPRLNDLISTGLACGATYGNVLLKALTEVVERDAYSIVWQNRLPRPHIDLEHADDPIVRGFVRVLDRLNIQYYAALLTLDIPIPVVLIVMTRSDNAPWTVVASGADLSPTQALILALEEACLALIGMGRAVAAAPTYEPASDYSNVTTLPLHGLAHALDPRLRSSVSFLTEPADIVKLSELPNVATGNPDIDLRTALDQIRPLVTDVVGVDVTTPDVDEVGFKVARVIVPDLQPMDIDHRFRHFGGRRLYDVPHKLGLVAKPSDARALSRQPPHPFP